MDQKRRKRTEQAETTDERIIEVVKRTTDEQGKHERLEDPTAVLKVGRLFKRTADEQKAKKRRPS